MKMEIINTKSKWVKLFGIIELLKYFRTKPKPSGGDVNHENGHEFLTIGFLMMTGEKSDIISYFPIIDES